jgi:hypothetical protein
LAYVGLNTRKSDVVRTDHPEQYFTIGRQFDILCELLNGPCRPNQELLFNPVEGSDDETNQFNPRDIEIILNICRRNVNDLNSGFIDIQSKAYTFLLSIFEGQYKEMIDLICEKLDPNHIYKILINYTKRLYLQTKYDSPDKTNSLALKLAARGMLSELFGNMWHYKKKKFDPDEVEVDSTIKSSAEPKRPKSSRRVVVPKEKNMLWTFGDLEQGDLGADKSSYNFWTSAPSKVRKF